MCVCLETGMCVQMCLCVELMLGEVRCSTSPLSAGQCGGGRRQSLASYV